MDLMKDLARTRPSTPDVDPERMERDLARIVSLPRSSHHREWTGAPSFRRLVPFVVAALVMALAIVVVPSDRPEELATTPVRWQVVTRKTELMVVGDAANPYVLRYSFVTDRWLSRDGQTTVRQGGGGVAPFSDADIVKWEAAGKPGRARQVGGNHDVRIGPVAAAVTKTHDADFAISGDDRIRFDALRELPTDQIPLWNALSAMISGFDRLPQNEDRYRLALLAMDVLAMNTTPEQQLAAWRVLGGLFIRNMEKITLPNGREGLSGVVPTPKRFQFTNVETQLIVDPKTYEPLMIKDVITAPQHGLAAGTAISSTEFLSLGPATGEPHIPDGVVVNGEVESPIMER
ncbi:hypothetical protein [Lentzea sp. NPDC051838]|uniref:hypothetical protein n=1 Tax=Lentzea sp. NPDC051838 TaxID=3154849 RepID=UPI003427D775